MNENQTKVTKSMNSRALATLLSSLISQLLILIFLLFPPSSNSHTISNFFSSPPQKLHESIFSLLQHFLSPSTIAAFISISRKRKRAHFQNPDGDDEPGSRLGRFHSEISRNPNSFNQFFKMKPSTFDWLCGLLEPLLDCRDPVQSPLNLPAQTRLGIGLYRLATGADYREISTRFGVSESNSEFCVKQLCRVLCTNFRFWVEFPSHTELNSVSTRFETLTGLPNCCGVINCTRFNFEVASGFDSVNQSIATQIVVDSSSKILSIIAGFNGNKSDIRILNLSSLCKDIEKGVLLNSLNPVKVNDVDIPQYLVGNGKYNMLPWLLLPFVNPEAGSVEENFNNALRLMFDSSFKAMASLRNWGILSRPVKMDHKIAVACIGACSILHNMLIEREDYSAFCHDFDDKELSVFQEVSLDGNLIEEKALTMRKAVATRAMK